MKRIPVLCALLALALIPPGRLAAAEPTALAAAQSEQLVRDYVDAYNAHDVDRMVSFVEEGFEWVNLDGQKTVLESAGRESAREGTKKYFAGCPSCRSTLLWVQVAGSRVVAHERAEWQGAKGPRAQTSLSIYELRGDKLARVYYFPAERVEPPATPAVAPPPPAPARP